MQNIPAIAVPPCLEVDINSDGANLGTPQIWPIECRAANIPSSLTEVIGIYKGKKKPESAMDFLRPFVEDTTKIIQNNVITFLDSTIRISLRSFSADEPARAFILKHAAHNLSSRPQHVKYPKGT